MLTVAEFYAEARWSDPWGAPRPDGTRHRGHDIACHAGEEIPALRAGTVVARGQSAIVGLYIVVRVSSTTCDFYCHLEAADRAAMGLRLEAGSRAGRAAGRADPHGTAWTGPHLHYGSGPRLTSVTAGVTYDATAIVRSVLAAIEAAGGGVSPLPEWKDPTMPQLYYLIGSKPSLYALAGASPGTPANWLETSDYDGLVLPFAVRYGDAIKLSAGTWADFKARYQAPLSVAGGISAASSEAIAAAVRSAVPTPAQYAEAVNAKLKEPGN